MLFLKFAEDKDNAVLDSIGKINIMHIISYLGYGGAEIFLVELVKNLDKERFNITICCLDSDGPLEEKLTNINNVDIIKLNLSKANLPFSLYRLFRIMRTRKIKIAHTHLFSCGFYGRIVAKLAGVPTLIAHEHGLTLWKKKRHVVFERWANRFTDLRIAVSESIRQNRIIREKTDPEKIMTIYNGIDTKHFDPALWKREMARQELQLDENMFCIGTVARLTQAKGLQNLLQAMKRTYESFPNALLVLVGDGPLREDIERYCREIGIDNKVIFTGFRHDIPNLLAAMDAFVLSSVVEGMPISLLEAMSMGKPVVASKVGGIPEVIEDRISGVLVSPSNPDELSTAITGILGNREFRNNIAINARTRIIEAFSIERTTRRIEGLYEELLAKKAEKS